MLNSIFTKLIALKNARNIRKVQKKMSRPTVTYYTTIVNTKDKDYCKKDLENTMALIKLRGRK